MSIRPFYSFFINKLSEDWHKAWHRLEWFGTEESSDVIRDDMNPGNFCSVECKVDKKVYAQVGSNYTIIVLI